MILADTSFLIDFMNGEKEAIELMNTLNEPILTTIISHYEIFVGAFRHGGVDAAKDIDDAREFLDNFEMLNLDRHSMLESAKICARLMSQGNKIDDNDCMIAGIALKNGISTIITRNKSHFDRIKGIKIISY